MKPRTVHLFMLALVCVPAIGLAAAAVHVLVSSVQAQKGGTTALQGPGPHVLFAAVELSP